MSWNSFWSDVGNGIKDGWNWLTSGFTPDNSNNSQDYGYSVGDFWNDLTGQSAEDKRTADTNATNMQIAKDTNATNLKIAQENLGYQRELQEYNKALQERIFEREDTSYQRTANDMIAAGLNPLTMQGTNGAGEAIAQSPLNNQFQAQGWTAQKAQTMNSPLQALMDVIGMTSGAAGSVAQLMQLGPQLDSLKLANERAKLENYVYAQTHDAEWILNEKNLHKYTTESAHYGADNAKREYNHKVTANKYDSDNQVEQLMTSILEALNGRYNEQIGNAKDNVKKTVLEKVPIVNDAVEAISNDNRNNTMKARAAEKGYTLGKGQSTTTIIPHPKKGYNAVKVYSNKGKLIDLYYLDYDGNIIHPGTTTNENNTSSYSGKF